MQGSRIDRPFHLTAFLLLTCLLSACGEQVSRPAEDYFLPPTVRPDSSPIALETATPPPSSPEPECTNDLDFIDDVTIPDRTAIRPETKINKKWLVKNNGTCNWNTLYQVKMVAGAEMGAIPEQTLSPAQSGSEIEIAINFVAPEIPGLYSSTWQAFDPQGVAFGDKFYIEIIVDPSAPN